MAFKKQNSVGFTKITLLIFYPAAGEFELEAVLDLLHCSQLMRGFLAGFRNKLKLIHFLVRLLQAA